MLLALFKHRLLPSVWNILSTDNSCDGNDEAAHTISLATVAYNEVTGRFDYLSLVHFLSFLISIIFLDSDPSSDDVDLSCHCA